MNRAFGDGSYVAYACFVRFEERAARVGLGRNGISEWCAPYCYRLRGQGAWSCRYLALIPIWMKLGANSDLPPRAAFDKRVGGDVAEWSKALPC